MKYYNIIMLILLMIPGAFASYCYQETANVSTACGGLDSGAYYIPANPNANQYFYVNYTIPEKANSSSLWQVKHGELSTYNTSIDESCWNIYPTKIMLRLHSYCAGGSTEESWGECYDGNNWILTTNIDNATTFANGGGSVSTNEVYDGNYATYIRNNDIEWVSNELPGIHCNKSRLFEEGMFWNISDIYFDHLCYQEFTNISTDCGGTAAPFFIAFDAHNEWIDGNYDTFAPQLLGETQYGGYLIPYDKIVNLSNSFWVVKDNFNNTPRILSLPLTNCVISHSDSIWYIQMGFSLFNDTGLDTSSYQYIACDDLHSLKYDATTNYQVEFYEEAMYWDITDKNITITNPLNNSITNQALTGVTYSMNFDASECWYGTSLNNYATNTSIACSGNNFILITLNEGNNNITIWATYVDENGNNFQTSRTTTVTLDTTFPTIDPYGLYNTMATRGYISLPIIINTTITDTSLSYFNLTLNGIELDSESGITSGYAEANYVNNYPYTLSPGTYYPNLYVSDGVNNIQYPYNIDNWFGYFKVVNVTPPILPTTIISGRTFNVLYKVDKTGTGYDIFNFDAIVDYYIGGSLIYSVPLTTTADSNFIYYTGNITAPFVTEPTKYNVSAVITLTDGGSSDIWSDFIEQTVLPINITNCSSGTPTLTFSAFDEVNLTNISDYTLDIDVIAYLGDYVYGDNNVRNFHFSFKGNHSYSLCINNISIPIDAVMSYTAENYSVRKYFIFNQSLSNNTLSNVNLYLLNADDSTDVIYKTVEDNTGNLVPDAIIKILRYYPGENLYRTVEIEKTDSNAMTVGKVVLADVWYKYIVEAPPGTLRLTTSIEKVTSAARTLILDSNLPNLNDVNQLLGIQYDVSCTKSTNTCRFSWNNPRNTAVTGKLSIFTDNGWTRELIYNSTASVAAGTLIYTIVPENGLTYIAQGAII